MKNLIISLILLTASFNVFAKSTLLAIDAFTKSADVKSARLEAIQNGLSVDSEPTAAYLGGGCGFVGCDEHFLVTLAVSTKGANPQTHVISAKVMIPAIGIPQVELTSAQGL